MYNFDSQGVGHFEITPSGIVKRSGFTKALSEAHNPGLVITGLKACKDNLAIRTAGGAIFLLREIE